MKTFLKNHKKGIIIGSLIAITPLLFVGTLVLTAKDGEEMESQADDGRFYTDDEDLASLHPDELVYIGRA